MEPRETKVKQKETHSEFVDSVGRVVAANVLRRILQASGISATGLAMITGLQKGAVSKYLNQDATPRLPALLAISSSFAVSLDCICDPLHQLDEARETFLPLKAKLILADRFSLNLAQILHERAISQKAFAKAIGVSENAVSKYITGKTTPEIDVLVRTSSALCISIHALVTGVEFVGGMHEVAMKSGRPENDAVAAIPAIQLAPSINSFLIAMGLSEAMAARILQVTPATVASWLDGTAQPDYPQLALMFSQIAPMAMACRAAHPGLEVGKPKTGTDGV